MFHDSNGVGCLKATSAQEVRCVKFLAYNGVNIPNDFRLLEYELEGFGIRLNKKPPQIGFKKKDKGGLNLTCLVVELYLS